MKKLHLDSEYRNRWIEFHLADGTIEDSRFKNWRQVAWDRVIKIKAFLRGNVHTVDCCSPDFLTFLNFRWGGQESTYNKDKIFTGYKPIKTWTIGWTDGSNCFLKDIDFYSGKIIKIYVAPLSEFMEHLHPIIINRIRG